MSEEFGPDFITVTDEDGNDFELEHLDTLEYNNEVYMAFFPAVSEDAQEGEPADIDLDDEEYGLIIMKVVEEDGEELLSTLDSDEELDADLQPVYGTSLCGRRDGGLTELDLLLGA